MFMYLISKYLLIKKLGGICELGSFTPNKTTVLQFVRQFEEFIVSFKSLCSFFWWPEF